VQDGQPWKPAGSPGPIQLPPHPSGSELTFFCFIAHLAPADICPPATDPATNISVSLDPTQILANGGSATVTANVTDQSLAPEVSETVTFDAGGAAGVTIEPTTNDGNGIYSATITTSSATPGTVKITATDTTPSTPITGSAPLSLSATAVGPPAHINVVVNPASIPADGTTTAEATASVTDASGNSVINDNDIQFSASSAGVKVGPTVNNQDGTYSATITPASAGQLTITATDSVANISGSGTLTVSLGPPQKVSVALSQPAIRANGTDTTTATATVADADGDPIGGQSVSFSAQPSDVTIGSGATCTTGSNGQCQVPITAGTTIESVTITATDSPATPGSAKLTLTSTIGVAKTIAVSLKPNTIPAEAANSTIATATIKDANGNPVDGDAVSFTAISSDTSVGIGNVVRGATGTGTYMVEITGSASPGSVTIFATDTSVTPDLIGQATLTLTPVGGGNQLSAGSLTVSVNPTSIFADGVSHAFATATVTANTGQAVPGDTVQFQANGQDVGSCITDGNGQCHITLTSTTVIGFETITAFDQTANLLSSNSVELSFVAQPPSTTNPQPTPTTPTTTTPKPKPTRPPASAPSASKIKASLAGLLTPRGASIKALLKKGSYAFSYHALAAGQLKIAWWDGPSAKKKKLIGSVTVTVGKARKLTAKLRLTSAGRSALQHATRLKVSSNASFKPSGKPAVSRSGTFMLH